MPEQTEKEDTYTEEGREKQLEDDELSGGEEAFMKGYDEAGEEKEEDEEEKKPRKEEE